MANPTPALRNRPHFNGETICKPTWVPNPDRVRKELEAARFSTDGGTFHRILLTLAHCLIASFIQHKEDCSDAFQVSAKSLTRILGTKHCHRILQILSDSGILKRRGNYKVGRHPFSYKLAPWCWEAVVRLDLEWPVRALQPLDFDSGGDPAVLYPPAVISHLQRSLELTNLPELLDLDAIAFDASQHDPNWNGKKDVHMRLAYDHFNDSDNRVRTSQKSGRVFHKVARLSRRLRKHLELQGASMAEVDISNAQPLLLLLLMRERNNDFAVDPQELETLLRHACAGSFYEEIERISTKDYSNRESLKKAVYKGLMFGRSKARFTHIFKDLEASYPSFAAALKCLQSRKGITLASELQRLEGDLVYNCIAPCMMKSLAGVPFLTVHDAFLVPVEHANRAAEIIQEAVKKARNVDVQVKINGQQPFQRTTTPR